jgi:hypothetical protein
MILGGNVAMSNRPGSVVSWAGYESFFDRTPGSTALKTTLPPRGYILPPAFAGSLDGGFYDRGFNTSLLSLT